MKIEKQQLLYMGIGVFIALVILNTKNNRIDEITDSQVNRANFDASRLPSKLQPPKRLSENEPLPLSRVEKKNFQKLFVGNPNAFFL